MGCDIHAVIEEKVDNEWEIVGEFAPYRNYGLFAFLTGGEVRNYSGISSPFSPRGIPDDCSSVTNAWLRDYGEDGHTHSWLSGRELLEFDYEGAVEDRRVAVQIAPNHFNGGATCESGGGTVKTWREFLGEGHFKQLDKLRGGEKRIVFFFDN